MNVAYSNKDGRDFTVVWQMGLRVLKPISGGGFDLR